MSWYAACGGICWLYRPPLIGPALVPLAKAGGGSLRAGRKPRATPPIPLLSWPR